MTRPTPRVPPGLPDHLARLVGIKKPKPIPQAHGSPGRPPLNAAATHDELIMKAKSLAAQLADAQASLLSTIRLLDSRLRGNDEVI